MTKKSIKHQSFVQTQLNVKTVLFQTIQFSISHLFALSLSVEQFYLPIDRALSGATTLVLVDLGVMTMKVTPDSQKLLHYLSLTIRLFCVISTSVIEVGSNPSTDTQ